MDRQDKNHVPWESYVLEGRALRGFRDNFSTYLPPMRKMTAGMSDTNIEKAIDSYYARDKNEPIGYVDKDDLKDAAQKAQGVYYHDSCDPDSVIEGRKLFVPSLRRDGDNNVDRTKRAEVLAKHMQDNERFTKSEYAWEADAWSDVFGKIRDDPHLAADKREIRAKVAKTDEVKGTLIGESHTVKRIPDATFGLSMFPKDSPESRAASGPDRQLCEDQLALLYAEFKFAVDPRMDRDDTSLIFPWGVYEAKGWAGDCRDARRQALAAGAAYLDMLDCLARKPDFKGVPTTYQTPGSRNFQVFALTSYGAQWHINVGYRRRREQVDHKCADWVHPVHVEEKRVSEYVYIFQRVWSGRVVTQRRAYELLTLIDQIQYWATHQHRDFVTRHLVPWTRLGREWELPTFNSDDELPVHQTIYTGDPQKETKPTSSHRRPLNIDSRLAKRKGSEETARVKSQSRVDKRYHRMGDDKCKKKQLWSMLEDKEFRERYRREQQDRLHYLNLPIVFLD
ncbi:hypothetical protein BU16DRAFT_602269 [Lophium mytilinum]|uniref:Uncharacterized protein n=1 Tax=Lophium mytilinum TaxID=390894 RepID=A0A6A6R7I8_9PEZI|nr:hypothetical protein BU16DRAFT_602269 [Lophium mytilinum]